MMRVALFMATNIAVLLVLTLIMQLFGLEGILAENGVDLNLTALLIISAVIGFGGALISLAMSKSLAKRSVRAQVIEQPGNATESWLLSTVERQAREAGIGMPEVAVYDAPEPNAFATGMKRNDALVAVSTGLLKSMDREQVEAVLGHEVSHVANGDMVTLTLIQGVLNTFVFFLSRVIGHIVDRVVFRTERGYGPGYLITVIVAQVVLGILASIVVAWFSRRREFRADAGGAALTSPRAMMGALDRLRSLSQPAKLPDHMQAFGISGGGLMELFATHPPLDKRIEALRSAH